MEIKAIGCEPLQLKRVHLENSHTLKVYQDNGGYASLKKALNMSPDAIYQRSKIFCAARARRRGFSDRNEMVVCAEGFAETKIYRLQRRRKRAGNI